MNAKKIWTGIVAGAAISVLTACLMPVGDGEGLDESGDPKPGMESLESIQPLLAQTCRSCHGANGEAGLRLNSFPNALNSLFEINGVDTNERPATTGAGAGLMRIKRGSPDSSHLYQRITATDGIRMPPEPFKALDPKVIARVKKWIEDGAPIYDTTKTAN